MACDCAVPIGTAHLWCNLQFASRPRWCVTRVLALSEQANYQYQSVPIGKIALVALKGCIRTDANGVTKQRLRLQVQSARLCGDGTKGACLEIGDPSEVNPQ